MGLMVFFPFSFGNIYVHNVFINFISLIGLTTIFKAFKPFLHHKEKVLFYLLALIPSILFWGSGLLKESIIFFALGLFFLNLFRLSQQFKLVYLGYLLLSVLLIIYTKFYLLVALSIPVLGYVINVYLKRKTLMLGYFIASSLFIAQIT